LSKVETLGCLKHTYSLENTSPLRVIRDYENPLKCVQSCVSIDPLAQKFPSFSPYVFANNSPIKLIDINGESAGDPSAKFNRKYENWKAKHSEELVGMNQMDMYEKFKNSKNIFGKENGDANWFKAYENQMVVSKVTGWDVQIKSTELSKKAISGGNSSNGSLAEVVDVGTSKGSMEINYDMYKIGDRFQVVDAASGKLLFDTKTVKGADKVGSVTGTTGSGKTINFDLKGGTKVKVIVNEGKGDDATQFEYKLNVKSISDEKTKEAVISSVPNK
jgi:hypothetical protein